MFCYTIQQAGQRLSIASVDNLNNTENFKSMNLRTMRAPKSSPTFGLSDLEIIILKFPKAEIADRKLSWLSEPLVQLPRDF
jgi:hypothetical protein